ncbi:MAG: hypothetical protein JNN20_10360 [Betaproteobacteria bacterium]|nr:hypothetical protein [Betaproteobacteria bacterium]
MKTLALTIALAASQPVFAQPPSTTAPPPAESLVKVSAEVRDTAKNGIATVRVSIQYESQQLQRDVQQRPTTNSSAKNLFGWKDGYLFVRDDCLIAEEVKRPWRCVVDQVYALVDTKDGKRLAHLGDVHTGEDCIDEPKIGCSLYQGVFTDIYDRLENHATVSRADAPAPLIEMRVRSGELVVDLDETWDRNQERFTAGQRCLSAPAGERAAICVEGISPRRAYLFNSVLASYTKREEQLDKVRSYARSALCDRDNSSEEVCSEVLRVSALMLASIRPGEKARPRSLAAAPVASASK